MITLLISNLISALLGLIIGVLFEEPLIRLRDMVFHSVKRALAKFPPTRQRRLIKKPETFTFGPHTTSWLVVDGNGELEYASQSIQAHMDPHPLSLPPDLLERKKQIQKLENQKRRAGQPFLWNGALLSLDRFIISRTDLEEYLALELWFKRSDYYTFLATNMSLDEEKLHAAYLEKFDWHQPVEFFSTGFGINLTVLTRDEHIVLTRRSGLVGSMPGAYSISVNEGLTEFLDRGKHHDAPNIYDCAIRGAQEELGLELTYADIRFLSLGVDTRYSQWGLLGIAKTSSTIEEIQQWRARGVKDKWENEKVYLLKFDLENIVEFILSHTPWTPGGLTCLYHTLVHEFGHTKVEKAVKKAAKRISQSSKA